MKIEEIHKKTNNFSNYKKQLELNKPFHFNIVDSIKTRENDHSRILGNILNKNDDGSFTLLKSYLEFFGIKEKLQNPIINIEKGRIDVSIIDTKGNYAIIIENKIFDAVDQPNQINNYYESIRNRYKTMNIYVQYLTKFGVKKPIEESLSKDLELELGDNFSIISYSKDILKWLSNFVLPNCKIKNKELIYSLELYIDFIKGITNNRMNEKMEIELQNKVNEILNLNNKSSKIKTSKYNEVIEKLEDFKNIIEKLNEPITYEIRGVFLKKLFTKLKEKGNWICVNFVKNNSDIENHNQKNFGFKNIDYKYENLHFSIEIQDFKRFLVGAIAMEPNQFEELSQKFKPLTGHLNRSKIGWIVRLFKEFEIDTESETVNFVDDFYNSKYNTFFLENMELIIDKYYSEINIMFNEWKIICGNK
jgi:hypothetical protein